MFIVKEAINKIIYEKHYWNNIFIDFGLIFNLMQVAVKKNPKGTGGNVIQ